MPGLLGRWARQVVASSLLTTLGGAGLTKGAVFGRIAGEAAAKRANARQRVNGH